MRMILEQYVAKEADATLLASMKAELEKHGQYTLWLCGDMGAGKTSLVRAYLYSLGLSEKTPVVSPTYTIMNEYRVQNDWYAHLDLYRADDRFSLDELGIHDVRTFKGTFVEWPEQAGEAESLPPTHKILIETDNPDERRYTFFACD